MKKELPIAACLLALGSALCFNSHTPSNHALANDSLQSASQPTAQSPATLPPPSPANVPVAGVDNGPASAFLKISSQANGQQDLWCKSTIEGIGRTLNRLPSCATRMRLDCHVGDIDIAARGKFFQTAEGRKTRLEIIFEDAGTPLSLLQICDSQFSYTLRSTGNQQRLEFVALDRLENMDARLTDATTPASWVMGGGMGATLIYYAEAFHFQSVETSATGRIHVRGIWDSDALAMLLYSHLPVQDRPQEIAWDAVPTQIPHGIELSFVKGPDDLLQPEKISFFRFVREQGRAVAMPMLSINFEPLNTSLELPPALFQIETGGLEAMEMTDVYNQKIRAMLVGQPKIAHDPINSGQRR